MKSKKAMLSDTRGGSVESLKTHAKPYLVAAEFLVFSWVWKKRGPELGYFPHRFNSNVPPKSEASLHSKSVLLQDTPPCALASGVSTARIIFFPVNPDIAVHDYTAA
jgi:hypothetical protein